MAGRRKLCLLHRVTLGQQTRSKLTIQQLTTHLCTKKVSLTFSTAAYHPTIGCVNSERKDQCWKEGGERWNWGGGDETQWELEANWVHLQKGSTCMSLGCVKPFFLYAVNVFSSACCHYTDRGPLWHHEAWCGWRKDDKIQWHRLETIASHRHNGVIKNIYIIITSQ